MASSRQLFELLEEKQEPFLLDAYLIQNGCSSNRLQRLSSGGFKRRGAAFGFLRSILTKLVNGKPLSKALDWESKLIESGRLSVFGCCSGRSSKELGGDHQWRCIEMEDSKQLSPVSVLGFNNHRFKDENQSSTTSSDSPREDLKSPAFCCNNESHKRQSQGKQLLFDCVMEAEERLRDRIRGRLSPEIGAKIINEKIISWERLNGDVDSLTKLLNADMAEFRDEWSQFRPEVSELGVEIEAAIFEDIVDQTVLEVLGSHCT